MENQKKVMLSGIQPSGELHPGNYLGAIKNWGARADEFDCFYFMADMHTITVRQTPAELRRRTLEQVAQYIACWTRSATQFLSSPTCTSTRSWPGCWSATPCSASCPA